MGARKQTEHWVCRCRGTGGGRDKKWRSGSFGFEAIKITTCAGDGEMMQTLRPGGCKLLSVAAVIVAWLSRELWLFLGWGRYRGLTGSQASDSQGPVSAIAATFSGPLPCISSATPVCRPPNRFPDLQTRRRIITPTMSDRLQNVGVLYQRPRIHYPTARRQGMQS